MLGGLIQKLFGSKTDFKELVENGAVIIDVRSKKEFESGHIKGAKNIPLNELSSKLGSLKQDKTIITCCASGARSGAAKGVLKSKGFNVYNGGGWKSLERNLA
ncbi:rhodanese-like domain-containing protein [Profundicola chukchiensis]|uniref:rhodanese-like domain-containing protein n=1 Tax=Profundicola chukchiensis TaxID=2961959 RepID=UPI0034E2AB90